MLPFQKLYGYDGADAFGADNVNYHPLQGAVELWWAPVCTYLVVCACLCVCVRVCVWVCIRTTSHWSPPFSLHTRHPPTLPWRWSLISRKGNALRCVLSSLVLAMKHACCVARPLGRHAWWTRPDVSARLWSPRERWEDSMHKQCLTDVCMLL